jgi:hypothetical protein
LLKVGGSVPQEDRHLLFHDGIEGDGFRRGLERHQRALHLAIEESVEDVAGQQRVLRQGVEHRPQPLAIRVRACIHQRTRRLGT